MEQIQKHKNTIIIAVLAFTVGYIVGEFQSTHSFEQKMAQQIFNKVAEGHNSFKK